MAAFGEVKESLAKVMLDGFDPLALAAFRMTLTFSPISWDFVLNLKIENRGKRYSFFYFWLSRC